MDEILQKLLNSELLSEEAKTEISTQWNTSVESFKQMVREEETMKVRSEIAEQWTQERDALVENVEQFVATKLAEEIEELKSDIERFRDLEAEYAEKIVEEKHSMAITLGEELDALVDKMDAFFELRINEELEELREDLQIVKQNEFGRKIFQAYSQEFNESYIDEDSVQTKLAASTAKLKDAERAIRSLEESQAAMVREIKMEKILAPLNGKKKEQMQFVLQNIETSRLEEAYNLYIGRVLKEDAPVVDVERTRLTESSNVVVTGNESQVTTAKTGSADKFSHLRKLAGMN